MSEIETNQATETETPAPAAPKPKKQKVGTYPFQSKREILAKVEADDAYMLHCLCVLHARQTEHEQATKTTKTKNRRGFMSSHAVRGCELAEKVKGGEPLTDEDMALARGITSRYGRQLAQHFREEAIAGNPDLAKVAEVFSAA